jgi:hypothetical protein
LKKFKDFWGFSGTFEDFGGFLGFPGTFVDFGGLLWKKICIV